jgi:hypothetical protein
MLAERKRTVMSLRLSIAIAETHPEGVKECSQGLSTAKPLVEKSKDSHAESVQGLLAPFQGAGFAGCHLPRGTQKTRTPG